MVLRYERLKATQAVGQVGTGLVDYGRSLEFIPGSCTWRAGEQDTPPEPLVLYFDIERDAQTWAAPGARDTSIDAAVNFPDVASLTRYLNDPERYWVFYVDDVTNVSISYARWPRGGALPPVPFGTTRPDAGTATVSSDRALPAGTAPTGAAATARDTSPAAASTTVRRIQERRIWDVRTAPGPRGARISFRAQIDGLMNREQRVWSTITSERPAWNAAAQKWDYPDWVGFMSTHINTLPDGRFELQPTARLQPGRRYYYLIEVHASDPSLPNVQRTGSFIAAYGW